MKALEGVRLVAYDKYADNSLENPHRIEPAAFSFKGEGRQLDESVPALSFSIFVLERQ